MLKVEDIDILNSDHTINRQGKITMVIADNLGANGKGGFVESFSSNIENIK